MSGAEEGETEAGPRQPANKKHKQSPLNQLTREELEARVRQLEAHNTQLRNILSKTQAGGTLETPAHTKPQKQRQFDFSKHSRRHVALKLCYLGWDYQGFAVQEDSQNTIEAQLFAALLKTRLIESRETSNYHRCGRTDKGVSAFDQVISITLRSKLRRGLGVQGPTQGGEASEAEGVVKHEGEEVVKEEEKEEEVGEEINYVQMLNRVLPQEIRILAWCPVPQGFSARFDCCRRTYKYFFPRGGLDLQAMQEAGQHLVGEHDFRNLCKMDVGNGVVNFKRRILAVKVERVEGSGGGGGGGYEMCVATIEGQAFLWHQVRAVMAVLFLVGEGKEESGIVARLLDVQTHPRKPQYSLASDLPLSLWSVEFEGVSWRWDEAEVRRLVVQLQGLWVVPAVRATMVRGMLGELETLYKDMAKARLEEVAEEEKQEEKELVKKTKGEEELGKRKELRHKEEEEQGIKKEPEKKRKEEEELKESVLRERKGEQEASKKRKEVDECEGLEVKEQVTPLMTGTRTKVYRPLLSRPTCESLEQRVEHYVKRQRLDPGLLQNLT